MDELSCALLLVSRTVSTFAARMALALIVIGLVEEQERLRQVLQELSVRHDPRKRMVDLEEALSRYTEAEVHINFRFTKDQIRELAAKIDLPDQRSLCAQEA